MTDKDRVDWLEITSRLQDVYWWVENEGVSVREAIDWLAVDQTPKDPPILADGEGKT